MTFKAGQSGNPSGRSKADLAIRDAARAYGEEALLKLAVLMRGEDVRVAKAAADSLLDRGFGKPPQSMQLSGDNENPLVHVIERVIVKAKD